jgi:hypothetical protein
MGSRGVALIAGFWLAVFVLYPPAAGLTHMVAPETLATFLFSITLAGIVLIGSPHLAFASRLAMTAVTVLTSVMLALLRPHWQLAALLLPWLLPFLAPWGQRKAVTVCTAVAVAASVVVLLVPEWALQRRYDAYLSGVFGPRVLFCSSADLVHPYLVRADDDEFSVRVRDSLGQLLTVEARARATDWALLGFNSDLCTYGGTARIVADRFANAPGEETRYYLTTYLHALTADPLYLPARLGRNFVAVASRPFPAVATDYWVRYDDHVLLENADSRALFRNWADRHRPLFSGDIDLPSRRWLLGSRMFFAGAGLLMSLMTLAAAISLPVFQRRGHASALARPFAVTLVCSLAANALIAVVHTFEPRYLVMQAPMFVMLGFLATTAVIDSATKTWHRTSARW